jgi:DNA polymerase III subunit delta'
MTFSAVAEQAEAKRLLEAALAEGPAHAYLLHGPPGVGKRAVAFLFAAELLGEHARVERRLHPDLYVLEPLGDQIRIDDIRTLRRDLHMRPFEAQRRVYLVFGADTMNEDAADALLKDLEEPPEYAVIVLVANDLGPLPETIRSRCQPVPFRRLSERAVREAIVERAPELAQERLTTLARVAGGRLDRVERLLDPAASRRREALLEVARAVYLDPAFDSFDAAALIVEGIDERGGEARDREEETIAALELPTREAEQRVRRAQRGAERDELLAVLEELESWYRDLVVLAAGAEGAVVHVDRLAELREDATLERLQAAEQACEIVRSAWRDAEELQLTTSLALEALLIRLRRELAGPALAKRL